MNYSAREFSKRFSELCEAQGLSPRQALKAVFGMDGSNLQKWRSEESTPKADLYLAVAEHFDVTTDYLYGRPLPAQAEAMHDLTPEEKQLIAQLRQADGARRELAMRVLNVMLAEEAN